MKACCPEAALTPTDYKTLEGQRIQALMAAVAALPGAGLVTTSDTGAPLFAAALIAIAAAFMFWIFTDGIYHFSTATGHTEQEWARLYRAGYRYQWSTVGYGAISIFLTMAGFAGVHSDWTTPISVEAGFVIDAAVFLVVLGHVVWASHERNLIGIATRAASLRAKAATP